MDNTGSLSERLKKRTEKIIESLGLKGIEYGDSWKKRGGVGAFMNIARKWDRIENICSKNNWDIFEVIRIDQRPEGITDDIDDLIAYLLLIRDEMDAQKELPASSALRPGEIVAASDFISEPDFDQEVCNRRRDQGPGS